MVEIIGVRFNSAGKIYYFDPEGEEFAVGTKVLVETAHGVEMGHVVTANKAVGEDEIVAPLKPIVRKATEEDFLRVAENKEKEKDAYIIAAEKIREHKIEMKLVDVEYTFDRSKILFYFTADGRVDFRELVKSLAGIFHTRIELRQIGVRDEARQIGSYGICGRNLCCGTFLDDFRPVSIKMAKEQGLSLNPTKISGVCGRLMCCLQYEQNAYDDMLKKLPHKGTVVNTPDGKGVVVEVATLKGEIKVKFDDGDNFKFSNYKLGEFSFSGDRAKRTETNETSDENPEVQANFEADGETVNGADFGNNANYEISDDLNNDLINNNEESKNRGGQRRKRPDYQNKRPRGKYRDRQKRRPPQQQKDE